MVTCGAPVTCARAVSLRLAVRQRLGVLVLVNAEHHRCVCDARNRFAASRRRLEQPIANARKSRLVKAGQGLAYLCMNYFSQLADEDLDHNRALDLLVEGGLRVERLCLDENLR